MSQETCRHMSPIHRAGRAEERMIVVATEVVQPGGYALRSLWAVS